jgi:hypothetical protein
MPHARVPDAWPLFLTMDMLIAYLGGDINARTVRKICPVHPLDLGANKVRYHRLQIDAWADTLKPRLPKTQQPVNDDAPEVDDGPITPEDNRMTALERVQARMAKGAKKCRKTG